MIVVGTTLTNFVMDDPRSWGHWLLNSDVLRKSHPDGVRYFAAVEVDGRGDAPFAPLYKKLKHIDGEHFTYRLDDGRTEVTSRNRFRHIVTGRNLVIDYAVQHGATHVLFLDADVMPDPETLPKLLAMDHGVVGGEVGSYCLKGPKVDKYPFPVEEHMNTAGYLLVRRDVFNRIRWRWELGMSDDPCFHRDAIDLLGVPTYVRKDCIGQHWPPNVIQLEQRKHDRTVIRTST